MVNSIICSMFWIFCGAAILATIALYSRQSLLVAYILLGAILGPWGFRLIEDSNTIKDIGDIGIIFLLFLLGLNLQPQNLLKLLRQTTIVTILTSGVFAALGYSFAALIGLNVTDAIIVAVCMMFSSTIIGLKLLPTTVMHHQKTGELVVSILLLQDLIAIFALLIIHGFSTGDGITLTELFSVFVSLPGLVIFAFLTEKYVLIKIFRKFNKIPEYLFLLSIAWCLGLGQIAHWLHLSFEIGAFIAGISIAQSLIARFIAESLKPLRDFFLILFFFSLGAQMDLSVFGQILLPALLLGLLMIFAKPFVMRQALRNLNLPAKQSWEIAIRLGQISEFSLLVAYTASKNNMISNYSYNIIQTATVITFMLSSFWIVKNYPTPIAVNDKLRRD